jgi:hypothetical protein
MNKPNLFLIGAMKSGTTTLHDLLAAHPQICMCQPKEPCYFVEPAVLETHWPEMWRMGFWRDESAYLRLFGAKPSAKYFGESSTDYTKQPAISGIVERIADFNPDARFIYIMRDPVERTISHYWHMVEHRGETRKPMDAISRDRYYMDVSDYPSQLKPYLKRFGRDRLYVLTFERLRADANACVRGVHAWLGVEEMNLPESIVEAKNVTPAQIVVERGGTGWANYLRHSALWQRIGPNVPRAVRQLGVALVEKQITRRETDMSTLVDYLRPIQVEQTAELVRILDRRFDEWTTLYGK